MDDERRRELIERRKALLRKKRREELRRRRRRQLMIKRAIFGVACLAVLLIIIFGVRAVVGAVKGKKADKQPQETTEAMVTDPNAIGVTGEGDGTGEAAGAENPDPANTQTPAVSTDGSAYWLPAVSSPVTEGQDVFYTAARQAAMYDYDAAIATLSSYAGYENLPAFTEAINIFNEQKMACVPADVFSTPHVFFHSLLNDDRGFIPEMCGDFVARDNGCWMCSVNEFNVMIQQMYDSGYVLVRLRDLVVETVDENGVSHYQPNTNLMLPAGKKPLIMSEDDLSYYHAYGGQGIAEKLVLDDQGRVKCVYTDEAGNTSVGDYDMVPLLSKFIDEHPDFSYRNAHAIIALTGYNGVFGYRTDSVYLTRDPERLDDNQIVYLQQTPDFNYENEVAQAKVVADALKAEGYEFASHTWGHRHADTASVESLMEDNNKWVDTVQPITGPVDTIIFAHGSDIGDIQPYTMDNEKYAYFYNSGYRYFCNVDGSTPVWMQINDTNVRSGRINLDGYRLYQTMSGNENSINVMNYLGIHDIESFFDYARVIPVAIPE
ncbi:MAG: polysaccharide deacetylase [Lachnospiraceae bacterium]|nr:polysaccharide deacetylase [Lachnospiraceae bacterium]